MFQIVCFLAIFLATTDASASTCEDDLRACQGVIGYHLDKQQEYQGKYLQHETSPTKEITEATIPLPLWPIKSPPTYTQNSCKLNLAKCKVDRSQVELSTNGLEAALTDPESVLDAIEVTGAINKKVSVLTHERQFTKLICPDWSKIQIIEAFYGSKERITKDCELRAQEKSLIFPQIQSWCNKVKECFVWLSDNIALDPCPSLERNLKVTFNCIS